MIDSLKKYEESRLIYQEIQLDLQRPVREGRRCLIDQYTIYQPPNLNKLGSALSSQNQETVIFSYLLFFYSYSLLLHYLILRAFLFVRGVFVFYFYLTLVR